MIAVAGARAALAGVGWCGGCRAPCWLCLGPEVPFWCHPQRPLARSLTAVWEVSQEGDTCLISGVGRSGGDPGRGSPLSSGAKMKRGRILLASVRAMCDKCLETLLLP